MHVGLISPLFMFLRLSNMCSCMSRALHVTLYALGQLNPMDVRVVSSFLFTKGVAVVSDVVLRAGF